MTNAELMGAPPWFSTLTRSQSRLLITSSISPFRSYSENLEWLDDRNDTVSARQFAESALWDRTSNETAWKALLGDLSGAEEVSYYAAPARAMNVTNMPSTYIECGSCETFRDEDVTYAARLWAAGVQAELHVWPGAFHGFDALAPWAALSIEARRARRKWLQRAISNQ